ncbi:MAG: hypothetical protein ACM3SP_01850 [Chloroflexota bacterium]
MPVIPIGFLLVFYDPGAAAAADEAINLDAPAAAQAEVAPAGETAGKSPVDGKIGAPRENKDNEPQLKSKSTGSGAQSASKQAAAGAKTSTDVKAPKAPSKNTPPAAINPPAAGITPPNPSPSILQMVEGRERELWIGASIAVAFFSIGWVSGGKYYVRRERRRRTKLSF